MFDLVSSLTADTLQGRGGRGPTAAFLLVFQQTLLWHVPNGWTHLDQVIPVSAGPHLLTCRPGGAPTPRSQQTNNLWQVFLNHRKWHLLMDSHLLDSTVLIRTLWKHQIWTHQHVSVQETVRTRAPQVCIQVSPSSAAGADCGGYEKKRDFRPFPVIWSRYTLVKSELTPPFCKRLSTVQLFGTSSLEVLLVSSLAGWWQAWAELVLWGQPLRAPGTDGLLASFPQSWKHKKGFELNERPSSPQRHLTAPVLNIRWPLKVLMFFWSGPAPSWPGSGPCAQVFVLILFPDWW